MRKYPTLPELFWRHVNKSDGCWRWTGAHMRNGYGHMGSRGKTYSAHRLSYELNIAPIPKGLLVLHRCDVRDCVNPSHLFVGTHVDNCRDMHQKGRGRSKLDPQDVERIRELRLKGWSATRLAENFKLKRGYMLQILRRHAWSWLV